MYIIQLSTEEQEKIREKLISVGIEDGDLELAMNSKLSDLEEVL